MILLKIAWIANIIPLTNAQPEVLDKNSSNTICDDDDDNDDGSSDDDSKDILDDDDDDVNFVK